MQHVSRWGLLVLLVGVPAIAKAQVDLPSVHYAYVYGQVGWGGQSDDLGNQTLRGWGLELSFAPDEEPTWWGSELSLGYSHLNRFDYQCRHEECDSERDVDIAVRSLPQVTLYLTLYDLPWASQGGPSGIQPKDRGGPARPGGSAAFARSDTRRKNRTRPNTSANDDSWWPFPYVGLSASFLELEATGITPGIRGSVPVPDARRRTIIKGRIIAPGLAVGLSFPKLRTVVEVQYQQRKFRRLDVSGTDIPVALPRHLDLSSWMLTVGLRIPVNKLPYEDREAAEKRRVRERAEAATRAARILFDRADAIPPLAKSLSIGSAKFDVAWKDCVKRAYSGKLLQEPSNDAAENERFVAQCKAIVDTAIKAIAEESKPS